MHHGKQKYIQQIEIDLGKVLAVCGTVIEHKSRDEDDQILNIGNQCPQDPHHLIVKLMPDIQTLMILIQEPGTVLSHILQTFFDGILWLTPDCKAKLRFQTLIGQNDSPGILQGIVDDLQFIPEDTLKSLCDILFRAALRAGDMVQPLRMGLTDHQLVDCLNGISHIGEAIGMVASIRNRAVPESIETFPSADRPESIPLVRWHIMQTVNTKYRHIPAQLFPEKTAAFLALIKHDGTDSSGCGSYFFRHRLLIRFSVHFYRGKVDQPPFLHRRPGQQDILQTGGKAYGLRFEIFAGEIPVKGPQKDGHIRPYTAKYFFHRSAVIGKIILFIDMRIVISRIAAARKHIQPMPLFMQFQTKPVHHR